MLEAVLHPNCSPYEVVETRQIWERVWEHIKHEKHAFPLLHCFSKSQFVSILFLSVTCLAVYGINKDYVTFEK